MKTPTDIAQNACINGDIKTVEKILTNFQKYLDLEEIFMIAIDHGQLNIVQMLTKILTTVNFIKNGETPLFLATKNGYIDIVQTLLENGADVNSTDNIFEKTALHIACENNNFDMVDLLIGSGNNIDINIKNIQGYTPLMTAVNLGCTNIIKKLLNSGADYMETNYEGENVMHIASKSNFCIFDIMKILLGVEELKKLKNSQDNIGNTPLIHAVIANNVTAITILLLAGSDVNIKNNYGIGVYNYSKSRFIDRILSKDYVKAQADNKMITDYCLNFNKILNLKNETDKIYL